MKVPWKIRRHFVDSFVLTRSMTEDGAHLNKKVDRKRSFGFLPTLRTLLEFITPDWLLEPVKEEEIDPNMFELQRFRWVKFSAHRDGQSIPEQHGYLTEILLYGMEKVCYKRAIPCSEGLPQVGKIETTGPDKFLFIAALSNRYLRIMEIADHAAGRRQMRDFSPLVSFSPKLLSALRSHRQYKELQEYWKARGFVLELVSADGIHRYEVLLRKPNVDERIVRELVELGQRSAGRANVLPFKRVA